MTKPKRPEKPILYDDWDRGYNDCHDDHDAYVQYLEQAVKDLVDYFEITINTLEDSGDPMPTARRILSKYKPLEMPKGQRVISEKPFEI